MKSRLILFVIAILCGGAIAQEGPAEGEVVMFNPVTWGAMVYVKAEDAVKTKLLMELKSNKRQLNDVCSSKTVGWYCDKAPEVAFQALNGYGNPINEAILCEENKLFKEYKYFNKEIFIHSECLVVTWKTDTGFHEFHTIDAWCGDDCQ